MKRSRNTRGWFVTAIAAAAVVLTRSTALAQPQRPEAPFTPPPAAAKAGPFDPYAGQTETLPIDLPTALRLAGASSPTIAIAQARVREARARQEAAAVAWLPNLVAGATDTLHHGLTQNQRGDVFDADRRSLFLGGGAQLRFDVSDALYGPLVARRLTQAAAAGAQAVTNNVLLDVALTYEDLLQVHGLLAVNADILFRAEQNLDRAEAATKAGMSKSAADINRARTEVYLRRDERRDLTARAAAVSARLARLLLLKPTVDLVPADPVIVPVTLVPTYCTLDDLVNTGLANRPEVAATRTLASAADVLIRQARTAPLVPRVQVDYLAGGFGGGRDDLPGLWGGRGDLTASVYWDLQNLGLGDRAKVRERRAQADQARFRVIDVESTVGAEITEAAKVAVAHFDAIDDAQEAVRQASEMYRKLSETQFGMLRGQYESIEPLLAIQQLNQARVQYLNEVIAFNRAQFQLFTAMGQPADSALPQAAPTPLDVPVAPPPPAPAPKR